MSDDPYQNTDDPFADALARAGRGEIESDELMAAVLAQTFVVPSESDVDHGAGFSPMLVTLEDGKQYLAAFTTPTLAGEASVPFSAWMTGAALVAGINGGFGLVVNPAGGGIRLEADTVQKLRASLPPAS